MYTILIRIADINIRLNTITPNIPKFCKPYSIPDGNPDVVISSSSEAIERERNMCRHKNLIDEYYETTYIHREICSEITKLNAFLLHSVAFEVDGRGFAFTAKSGVGKTTHYNNWQKLFGDRLKVINGDKPIVRFINDIPYICGTPWNGKENFGCNTMAPIEDVCFIERSLNNNTFKITKSEAFDRLATQVFMPDDYLKRCKMLELLDKFLKYCNFWLIQCDATINSASVASEKILGENIK